MINEKGEIIIPFSEGMIEYLKKTMKKEDTWHRFDCYVLKRGDVLYLSESCLAIDPLHELKLNPTTMKEFVVMKEKI